MTDIVERLRYWQSHDSIPLQNTMRDAADEIERLRREVQIMASGFSKSGQEIERLRAALQQIVALPAVDGLDPFEANRRGQEFRLNEQGREIARRALEPKP